ncbi:MAG: spore coat associated protein CotJA [Clostridiaceae bacterium]|nr:spore coat associated protein CotJA [Clostridiaceae bacterium]
MIPVMPVSPRLAEAYVPYQIYNKIFTPQEALKKGTVFPELART